MKDQSYQQRNATRYCRSMLDHRGKTSTIEPARINSCMPSFNKRWSAHYIPGTILGLNNRTLLTELPDGRGNRYFKHVITVPTMSYEISIGIACLDTYLNICTMSYLLKTRYNMCYFVTHQGHHGDGHFFHPFDVGECPCQVRAPGPVAMPSSLQ